MASRLVFKKVTPDGLIVEIEEYDGMPILLLAKDVPSGRVRPIQILGVATQEINTSGANWYYEYEFLPRTISTGGLTQWLENRGYTVGTFDQFGNFRQAA